MLRRKSKYNLYLCVENKKSRKVSIYYRIDGWGVPIVMSIIFIVVPSVIVTVLSVYVNEKFGAMIAISLALALYCTLILICCSFTCYYIKYTLSKYTEAETVHADNPIEDENVLEELICHNVIKREKSVQANITVEDATYIPELTPEEERYYTIRGKVRGRRSTGSRSIASNTTGFVSMFPEDESEQISLSASKPTTLNQTFSKNHNINVSKDVVVHSLFNSCQNSFDTDSLETQVVK
ncbi:MAG: hypothetical protein U0X86_000380 [Wolbachia endosymbiont of Xenopsylla cheopis]